MTGAHWFVIGFVLGFLTCVVPVAWAIRKSDWEGNGKGEGEQRWIS